MRRPWIFVLTTITATLLASTIPANAESVESPPAPTGGIYETLSNIQFPDELLRNPAGRSNVPHRDFGTPTSAKDKVCPFVGGIPVSLPVATLPAATTLMTPGAESGVDTHVYGELCMSRDALAESRRGNPPAVLVLVHGLSYGTWYWDFPYQPERYSTVNYLNQHGYATLNIDRIGIGRSGHPLSALATVPAQAAVVHQLIQKLKDGTIAGIRFPHTGLVGHSLGSIITYTETALYNDTEVNIGTGYSTRLNLLTAGSFAALATPAALSPVTSMQPWAIDPGYLQALPAGREVPQLYYQPNTDPGVVQKDKELANGASVGEWLTFFEGAYDGTYKHIKVPTFVINGEFDTLACGDNAIYCATDATSDAGPADLELSGQRFAAWEAPALNPGACLRAAVVPDAAHDVALHRNARQFQRLVAYFADQAMGVRGQQAADYRRSCVSTATSETASMLPELDRPLPPLTPPPPEAVITPLAETIDS